MARVNPFIWMSWLVFAFGWILLLAGVAALQQDCDSGAAHNGLAAAGVAGYLGPVPACKNFYGYAWWITWYFFLLLILIPVMLMRKSLSHFRAGLLGLLALLTMLLGDTVNTFLYFNPLAVPGKAGERARTVVAGGITASIAAYILIILIGLTDEKTETKQPTGEPSGETLGGRYQPKAGTTMNYNPTYQELVTTE